MDKSSKKPPQSVGGKFESRHPHASAALGHILDAEAKMMDGFAMLRSAAGELDAMLNRYKGRVA